MTGIVSVKVVGLKSVLKGDRSVSQYLNVQPAKLLMIC